MKHIRTAALAAALAVALPFGAHAGFEDNKPITVTTAGISTQGFFKVIVESLHAIFRDAYPGTSATFKPGSIAGGMVQVARGDADIIPAIPPVELQAAMAGTDPFKEPLKGKLLHLFMIMDNAEFYFIATKAWADQNGIKTFADIARVKPKANLVLGARGTPYINVAAEEVFKQYGYSAADFEKWGGTVTYLASGPMIDAMRDGKADLFVVAGFHPDARLVDLAKSREVIWLETDPAVLQKVADIVDMKVATFPAMYPFMTKPVPTLRASYSYSVGSHVSDETAYKIVKGVAENVDRVKAIHPSFKDFSVDRMTQRFKDYPLHPGAEKYFREKGLIK